MTSSREADLESADATPTTADEVGPFPGAEPPDRSYHVDAGGISLATYEWGDPDAPPLILVHGGFDFARTYEVFAPLLAAAGWRVVSWDQRGHGDSEHALLYSWNADVRDATYVFDHIAGRSAVPVIGHSKGGSLMLQVADAQPFRISALVNIDGIPSKQRVPDVAEHERTKLLAGDLAGWLEHRARTAGSQRKPGTIDELARRRARMNPRHSIEWLRYLVTVGGFERDDGWRWKIDPSMRFGGFGPWRPEWALMRLPGIGVPFYGMLAGEAEIMAPQTRPDDVARFLPPGGRLEMLDGIGHFAHIEQPRLIAERVLDFLGPPGSGRPTATSSTATSTTATTAAATTRTATTSADEPDASARSASGADPAGIERTRPARSAGDVVGRAPASGSDVPTMLVHNRIELALHALRDGAGRPLLLLHGLGEASPTTTPAWAEDWPGPIAALDFTGHGASTLPVGGGYTAEILLADADRALAHLGEATVVGRGLGAYVALLLAGARPDRVHGAVLADGPGLSGGSTEPTSQAILALAPSAQPPDEMALVELGRDLRPPDYADTFARLAVMGSALEQPILVAAAFRPAWLDGVLAEPGVAEVDDLSASIAAYAGHGDEPR